MAEEFKEIFNNYEISNMGNVRNIKTKRVLVPSSDVVITQFVYMLMVKVKQKESINLSQKHLSPILQIRYALTISIITN